MLFAVFMTYLLSLNAGAVDVKTTVGSDVTFDLPSFRICPNLSLHDPADVLILLAVNGVPRISAHVQARTRLDVDVTGATTLTLLNVSYGDEGTYFLAPLHESSTGANSDCKLLYGITIKREFEGTAYWLRWEPWSTCHDVTSCARGLRQRTRDCSIPSKCFHGSGAECERDVSVCIYAWSSWSEWSGCSVSCGSGRMRRHRKCLLQTDQSEASDSRQCAGEADMEAGCVRECTTREGQTTRPRPVHTWTSWGDWGTCTVSCGSGWRLRYRMCVDAHGREESGYCQGERRQNEVCSVARCLDESEIPSVTWTFWGAWSACSAACGSGWQTRDRKCIDAHAREVAGFCRGPPKQNNTCSDMTCQDLQAAAPSSGDITFTLSPTTIVGAAAGVFILVLLVVIAVLVVVLKRRSRKSRRPSTIQTVAEARTQMVEKRKHLTKAKQGKKVETKVFVRKKSEPRISRISEFHVYAEINDVDVYSKQPPEGQGQGHGQGQGRSMSVITVDNPYAPLPSSASPTGDNPGGHEFDFSSPTAGTYMNSSTTGTGEARARTGDRANKRLDSVGYLVPLQGPKSKVYTNQ